MTYNLEFDPRALKEWHKLGGTIRQQLKKKLVNVLSEPQIKANKLSGLPNCYKVKLRNSGYRLIYQVQNKNITVFVIAVGKREDNKVYEAVHKRI